MKSFSITPRVTIVFRGSCGRDGCKNYNYLCNQCLSPIKLWVRTLLRRGVLDTLCDQVYQGLTAGRRFSPDTPVSSTNKTDCHDITEILFKVVLNTINHNNGV